MEVSYNGTTYKIQHFYLHLTLNYLYWAQALQTWLFAMKYFESAITCSFNTTITQKQIKFIRWTFFVTYLLELASTYCLLISTFPGYSSTTRLKEWYEKIFDRTMSATGGLWFVLNVLSTFISIYSVFKIN